METDKHDDDLVIAGTTASYAITPEDEKAWVKQTAYGRALEAALREALDGWERSLGTHSGTLTFADARIAELRKFLDDK